MRDNKKRYALKKSHKRYVLHQSRKRGKADGWSVFDNVQQRDISGGLTKPQALDLLARMYGKKVEPTFSPLPPDCTPPPETWVVRFRKAVARFFADIRRWWST